MKQRFQISCSCFLLLAAFGCISSSHPKEKSVKSTFLYAFLESTDEMPLKKIRTVKFESTNTFIDDRFLYFSIPISEVVSSNEIKNKFEKNGHYLFVIKEDVHLNIKDKEVLALRLPFKVAKGLWTTKKTIVADVGAGGVKIVDGQDKLVYKHIDGLPKVEEQILKDTIRNKIEVYSHERQTFNSQSKRQLDSSSNISQEDLVKTIVEEVYQLIPKHNRDSLDQDLLKTRILQGMHFSTQTFDADSYLYLKEILSKSKEGFEVPGQNLADDFDITLINESSYNKIIYQIKDDKLFIRVKKEFGFMKLEDGRILSTESLMVDRDMTIDLMNGKFSEEHIAIKHLSNEELSAYKSFVPFVGIGIVVVSAGVGLGFGINKLYNIPDSESEEVSSYQVTPLSPFNEDSFEFKDVEFYRSQITYAHLVDPQTKQMSLEYGLEIPQNTYQLYQYFPSKPQAASEL